MRKMTFAEEPGKVEKNMFFSGNFGSASTGPKHAPR